MIRTPVTAPGAAAIGPYSHGIRSNGFVFLSGQTPFDGATGRVVEGGIEAQVRQCFRNLGAVLSACGLSFDSVVKCNVFLVDMDDFAVMNRVYAEQFRQPHPARTTIGVAALPMKALVEIEMIASTEYPKEDTRLFGARGKPANIASEILRDLTMRRQHYIAYFFGGAFLANMVPHLVNGVSGNAFQSPFASPPALSSSTINVLWGLFNLVVAYLLICRVGTFNCARPRTCWHSEPASCSCR